MKNRPNVCRHYYVRYIRIECSKCGGNFLICPICSPGRVCPDCSGTKKPLTSDPESGLSAREMEVLGEIVKGLDNKHIAQKLHISIQTVRNHISTILYKLKANDRTQAAVLALRSRLVEIPDAISLGKEVRNI